MRYLPLRFLLLLVLLGSAGCAGTLEVGIEPAARKSLEATVTALAEENTRLAGELAALKATPGAEGSAGAAATASDSPPANPGATRPPDPPAYAEVNVPTADLYSGPGTTYAVVGEAQQGDRLPLRNRDQHGEWLQVAWEGEMAWIAARLTDVSLAVAHLPVVAGMAPPPTATPSPTPTVQGPACDLEPVRGFGLVWGNNPEVAEKLGCASGYPEARELPTDAAVQTFEHGVMLWLAADTGLAQDPVYVLFDSGEYERFPDTGPADPAAVGEVEPGTDVPGERFSAAYWEGIGAEERERLGEATSEQMESEGAYQLFEQGRMFWSGTLDRVFVLYDHTQPQDGAEEPVRLRTWVSFEDTFVEPEATPEAP